MLFITTDGTVGQGYVSNEAARTSFVRPDVTCGAMSVGTGEYEKITAPEIIST